MELKTLRVRYWNPEPRVVDSTRIALEAKLRLIGNLDIRDVKAPDDPTAVPCDLLVIPALLIPKEDFEHWLKRLQDRIQKQMDIWIPALIVANIPFETLQGMWGDIFKSNWYFDIVSAEELDSLPIRVSNLLRIHDHLHELRRYSEMVNELQSQVRSIEQQLAK